MIIYLHWTVSLATASAVPTELRAMQIYNPASSASTFSILSVLSFSTLILPYCRFTFSFLHSTEMGVSPTTSHGKWTAFPSMVIWSIGALRKLGFSGKKKNQNKYTNFSFQSTCFYFSYKFHKFHCIIMWTQLNREFCNTCSL